MTSTGFHPEPPGVSKHAKRALARGLRLMILSGMNLNGSGEKKPGTHSWWNHNVENMYRCQVAGYKDEKQYLERRKLKEVDKWPDSGLIRKLVRWDGKYYYFGEDRECPNLTSSDVKKALLRETVIFEKSPFTDRNLKWAPVLSRMTQKFNEAFDEVVSKNPRPQKIREKKSFQASHNIPMIPIMRKKNIKQSPKLLRKQNIDKKKKKKKKVKCTQFSNSQKTHHSPNINNSPNRKKHNCITSTACPYVKIPSFHVTIKDKGIENLKTKSKKCDQSYESSFKYDMNNTCFRNRIIAIRNKYNLIGKREINSNVKPITSYRTKENCKKSSKKSKQLINQDESKQIKNEQKTLAIRKKERGKLDRSKIKFRINGKDALKYWFPEISTGTWDDNWSSEEINKLWAGRDTSSNSYFTETEDVSQSDSKVNYRNYDCMVSKSANSSFGHFSGLCEGREGNIPCYQKDEVGNVTQKELRNYNIRTLELNVKCDSYPIYNIVTKDEFINKNRKSKCRSKLYLTKIDVGRYLGDRFVTPNLSAPSSKLNSSSTVLDLSILSKLDNFILDRKHDSGNFIKYSNGDVPPEEVKYNSNTTKSCKERVVVTRKSVVQIE